VKAAAVTICAGAACLPVLLVAAVPAGAEVTGPCQGTIKGTNVAPLSSTNKADAIKVKRDDFIVVAANSSAPISSYKVQMEFAGISWTVGKGKANGNSWTKQVNVKNYSRYGVGLYKVRGVSSGAATCTGAALVQVEGSPFGSIAGMVGLGLSVIGAGGLVGSITSSISAGTKAARDIQYTPGQTMTSCFQPRTTPAEYVTCIEWAVKEAPVQTVQAMYTHICRDGAALIRSICDKGFQAVKWK
jgi:hypothetical protein